MAEVDVLRVIASIALIFFIPGYFLTKALFPRPRELSDEYPEIFTAALSMALSIAVSILSGVVLGMMPINPATGKGYFDSPYIELSLLGLSGVFAAMAWLRGAFPGLGRISPALERRPRPLPDETGVADDPKRYWREYELRNRRIELLGEIRRAERTARTAGEDRAYYKRRRAKLTQEIVAVDEQLSRLREERAKMIESAEEKAVKLEAKRRDQREKILKLLRLKRAGKAAPANPGKK